MERPWRWSEGGEPGADRRWLVLAELDPGDRRVLESLMPTVLGATGAEVVERTGLEEILSEVELSRRAGAFPAVLAGARMAERDLGRLARGLGNRSGTVPLVVMLPVPVAELLEGALSLGVCDVLLRPGVTGDDLVRALRHAFEVARRERAEERLRLRLLQPTAPATLLEDSRRFVGLGRTLAATSHELNNLLQPLIGYSDLLVRSLEPETRYAHYARQIERSSRLAATLVSRLLSVGHESPVAHRVEADAVLERAEELVRSALGSSIDLRIEPLARGLEILIRDGEIEQILLNLAGNARDAMSDGGRLTVRSTVEAGWWRLEVEDSGSGIPEEQLPHLFDAGYTTKEVGRGSGLGLWIVRGLVEEAGGEIAVESALGLGTRVVVRLPPAGGSSRVGA